MDYPRLPLSIERELLERFKLTKGSERVVIEDGDHAPEVRGVYAARINKRVHSPTIRVSIGVEFLGSEADALKLRTVDYYRGWIRRSNKALKDGRMKRDAILEDGHNHLTALRCWTDIAPTEPLWSQFYDQIQMILAQATLISAACGRR